jgi:chemotaxis response regulator CheB
MGEMIRVVVANQPRLMRELVLETIGEQPDIKIARVAENDGETLRAVEELRPDFLIIALENPDERPTVCNFLLKRQPDLKILAIAPNRNISLLYWTSLDIHSQNVENSEKGILQALRCGKSPVEWKQ